jgi:hypothetical protein
VKASDVTSPARSIEKRIFPPVFPSQRTVQIPSSYLRCEAAVVQYPSSHRRELSARNHGRQPVISMPVLKRPIDTPLASDRFFFFLAVDTAKIIAPGSL